MNLSESLQRGILIRRYNRFLSDIQLATGEVIQAHCPNSGSMMGLKEPGMPVWVSQTDNPKRKLKFTWELVETPDSFVGINTQHPNKLVQEALLEKRLPAFAGYDDIQPEKTCLPGTRLDFYVSNGPAEKGAYIEVKNVTLKEGEGALFPDAVTVRGQKHLRTLMLLRQQGYRGALIFVVQRQDVIYFSAAAQIDPHYALLLKQAQESGIEIYAYTCQLTAKAIILAKPLPLRLV